MVKTKLLAIFVIFVSLFSISFANIGFFAGNINSQNISENENILLNYTLINRDDQVKSQIRLTYELRRVNDMSLFYEKTINYSFAPYEVKKITESLNLNGIAPGEYILNMNLNSGSGTPLSFMDYNINILGVPKEEVSFSTLPYLKVYYQYQDGKTRYELSYSNTGKPIVPNSTFEIHYGLANSLQSDKNLKVKLFLKDSYSSSNLVSEIYSENILVKSNNIEDYEINYSLLKSGTYELFVIIADGEKILAKKEVRVVIMGQGGSIIDVFNKKDNYNLGENVQVEVSYVGPADAVSIVNDAYMKLDIIKDNNIISTETKKIIEFPFNPEKLFFNLNSPEKLDYYKLRVTIGKGEIVFDTVELNYEPLNAELIISPDGRIYNPNIKGCFDDNICSEVEKTIGNCMDCLIKKTQIENSDTEIKVETPITIDTSKDKSNENKNLIYVIIISIILVVVVIIIQEVKSNGKKK